jgi:hypothetical protein
VSSPFPSPSPSRHIVAVAVAVVSHPVASHRVVSPSPSRPRRPRVLR